MCKYLADALDVPVSKLRRLTDELEQLSGFPSEDIRLMTALQAGARQKISQLGLDPADTTAQELYGCLQNKYLQTADSFNRAINESFGERGSLDGRKLTQLLSLCDSEDIWAPKSTTLKKFIKAHPPKRLMGGLHYRTVESLLKRENPAKVASVAEILEPSGWGRAYAAVIAGLDAQDLELKPVKAFILNKKPWTELGDKLPAVIASAGGGAVLINPVKATSQSGVLELMLDVFSSVERLADIGFAVGHQRLLGRAGKSKAPDKKLSDAVEVAGWPIGWRVIRKSGAAEQTDNGPLEHDSETAVSSGLRRAHQQLSSLHPSLSWWKDTAGLIFVDKTGQATSLDLLDAAKNYQKKNAFNKQQLTFGRQSLDEELVSRYLDYPKVQETLNAAISGVTPSTHPKEKLEQLNVKYGGLYTPVRGVS